MPAFAPEVPSHRGTTPTLRPACAADAAAISGFLQGLSAATRRQRFHGHCNPRSTTLALQLCQVDGVRHQAWLAWVGQGDDAVVVGEARFVCVADADADADADACPAAAELAITVADDWQGRGVADALMRQLLAAAAVAGVRNLYGEVLDSNVRMQAFMRRHGFEADLFACGDVLRMCRVPVAPRKAPRRISAGAMLGPLFALFALFAPRPYQARPTDA